MQKCVPCPNESGMPSSREISSLSGSLNFSGSWLAEPKRKNDGLTFHDYLTVPRKIFSGGAAGELHRAVVSRKLPHGRCTSAKDSALGLQVDRGAEAGPAIHSREGCE